MPHTKVNYIIHLDQPRTRYVHVEIHIPKAPSEAIELKLPTWLPGAYKLGEFAANIEQFKATNGADKPVIWKKTDKLTWCVMAELGQSVTITYKVYTFQLADDASYLCDDFAIINPGTVCLAVIPYMEKPCTIKAVIPDNWQHISTGMKSLDDSNRKFYAADYHELMDCPMMIGNHYRHQFSVNGIPHEVAIEGKGNIDREQFLTDLEKMTQSVISAMQHVPYDRYVYLFLITDTDAGLEHCNSTLIFERRFNFKPRKTYLNMISIFSHELFHAWNVKALRPRELVNPNYFSETYTDLLWFSEGFTNYYHFQFLLRPGIMKPKEYIDAVAFQATRYRRIPGYEYQSTAEASFDAWIKYYRSNENTPNSTISYYLKGSIIAFFLDLDILKATGGKHRLDDLMRDLYQEHYVKKFDGFTFDDVVKTAERYIGKNLEAFFQKYVYGATDMPFEEYFRKVGLELTVNKPDDKDMRKGDLGLRLAMREHRPYVSVIRRNSAAQHAGILPNDEIVALDGLRVISSDDFSKRLEFIGPGATVEIMISRNGEIKTLQVVLGEPIPVEYTVKSVGEPTEKQVCLFKQWTGHEFSAVYPKTKTSSGS